MLKIGVYFAGVIHIPARGGAAAGPGGRRAAARRLPIHGARASSPVCDAIANIGFASGSNFLLEARVSILTFAYRGIFARHGAEEATMSAEQQLNPTKPQETIMPTDHNCAPNTRLTLRDALAQTFGAAFASAWVNMRNRREQLDQLRSADLSFDPTPEQLRERYAAEQAFGDAAREFLSAAISEAALVRPQRRLLCLIVGEQPNGWAIDVAGRLLSALEVYPGQIDHTVVWWPLAGSSAEDWKREALTSFLRNLVP